MYGGVFFPPFIFLGGLAQLARAPALQAGGQRFESVILHLVCSFRYLYRSWRAAIYDMLRQRFNNEL